MSIAHRGAEKYSYVSRLSRAPRGFVLSVTVRARGTHEDFVAVVVVFAWLVWIA